MLGLVNVARKAINFIKENLIDQIDKKDKLVCLAKKINWDSFGKKFKDLYASNGRPSLAIRKMVGLHMIKYMYNLSDDKVLEYYKHSAYVQHFCGETEMQKTLPCSNGAMSQFRRRIGEEGCKYIFQESVNIHGDKIYEEDVVVDSTVQPKNITYPTPTKLLAKVIGYCYYWSKQFGTPLNKCYKESILPILRVLRFEKRGAKAGEVKKSKKQLRTITINVVKAFEKALSKEQKRMISTELALYHKVIQQTEPKTLYYIVKNAQISIQNFGKVVGFCYKYAKDFQIDIDIKLKKKFIDHVHQIKNKTGKGRKQFISKEIEKISSTVSIIFNTLRNNLDEEQKIKIASNLKNLREILDNHAESKKNLCSIHEPGVACIAKGKDGKKFEFGSKASIVMTKNSGIIVGVKDFQGNPYDGKTLKPSLDVAKEIVGKMPKNVFTDRGYRGAQKDLEETTHHVPGVPKSTDTDLDKETARKNFGRRSAIEPVIGHVKSDFRLARNFLKGVIGDTINLFLAVAAFNLKKWCNSQS